MTTMRVVVRACSSLIMTFAIGMSALAAGGGSMYSSLGIGDLSGGLGVRNFGMGYTGVALSSGTALNLNSPASWAGIARTQLEAGATYQGFSSTDGVASRYIADITLLDAKVGFPISTAHGIAFVGGFSRYSNVDFDTYESGTGYAGADTIGYSIHHQGDGGLGVGKLGLSYTPLPWLAVGASFDYYFGTIHYIRTFAPTSTSYDGARFTETTTYHGPGGTFGVLVTGFDWIAPSLKTLAFGASFSTRSDVKNSSQTVLGFGSDPTNYPSEEDTSAAIDGTVVIPVAYTVGLAYTAGSRYVFATDFSAQLWKHSTFNGVAPSELGNSSRIGIGFERSSSRETNASWGERVALRLGATYGTLYYRPKNTAINQWLITGGATLPLSRTSRLALGLEYGARGTTSNGLVRDHIFRITASVSLGEQWFVQLPDE